MTPSAVATIYEHAGRTSAASGKVVISWPKTFWVGGLYAVAVIGGALTFAWDAFAVFLVFSAITLCLGHSLGMHRLLIHRSYACPKLLEYFFVYCGVLVGLAGPRGMMRTHDTRDWAQRQVRCHPYFAHQRPFLIDGFWQIFCDVRLDHPPKFQPPHDFTRDRFYRFMGESYHNNHHAFPGSARLGLLRGQVDPGWWVLRALARLRLVWDMKEAQDLPPRRELRILRSRRVRPDAILSSAAGNRRERLHERLL